MVVLAILLSLLLPAACGAEGAALPEQAPLPERYVELVRRGDAALRRGDYLVAEEAYEEASRVSIPESPNYEVLVKLAEACCRQGDTSRGREILKEFSCMLDVQVGRLPCFSEVEIGYLGERNRDLSDHCFERMCSEIYLGYYEDPPEGVVRRVNELRKEAERVWAECEGD